MPVKNQTAPQITERRRTFEGLERLTMEVKRLTQPILGQRGFAGTDILESWNDIVGENLAQGIRPEKLTFEKDNRTNGTLHVKSAGGAFAILFEHQKQKVIERINTFFGYPAVARIKITQGKLSLKKQPIMQPKKYISEKEKDILKAKVADIDDRELRTLVYQMGLTRLEKK